MDEIEIGIGPWGPPEAERNVPFILEFVTIGRDVPDEHYTESEANACNEFVLRFLRSLQGPNVGDITARRKGRSKNAGRRRGPNGQLRARRAN